jgi:dinuclear metal center YbgI/SA1388 family protein
MKFCEIFVIFHRNVIKFRLTLLRPHGYVSSEDNGMMTTAKRHHVTLWQRWLSGAFRGQPPSTEGSFILYSSSMNIRDFDLWCRSFLQIDALKETDDSLNGIQVSRGPQPLKRLGFAVDACAETFRRAVQGGADLLFVHHGLFWGQASRVEGPLLDRLRILLENNLALYACHLPLDMHPEVGNNAVLANLLALEERKPFGVYHGVAIGVSGSLPSPMDIDTLIRKILPDLSAPRLLIPPEKTMISKVAIVSGGAAFEAFQAFGTDIDLYITGEPSHSVYHAVAEQGLGFLAAGHYATETWGVKAVAEKVSRELGLETFFIDLPTGL